MEQGRFDWKDQDNEISELKEELAELEAKEKERIAEITDLKQENLKLCIQMKEEDNQTARHRENAQVRYCIFLRYHAAAFLCDLYLVQLSDQCNSSPVHLCCDIRVLSDSCTFFLGNDNVDTRAEGERGALQQGRRPRVGEGKLRA